MTLKLYGVAQSARTQKVLIAVQYSGLKVQCPNFKPGVDDVSDPFLAKSPLGRTPLLETPQGNVIGGGAIVRYFGRTRPDVGLYGESFFHSAQIDTWIDICQNELEVPLASWVYPALGLCPEDKNVISNAKDDVKSVMKILNKHLEFHTYLVGEKITIADIFFIPPLAEAYKVVFTKDFMDTYPNMKRWFETCINQAQFKAVLGELKISSDSEIKNNKEEKSNAENEDGAPKKKTNPLDDLPATTMVMDEWKRVFSNTPDLKGVAMKWLVENIDKSGYSFWFMRYDKMEGECEMDFVTCNLLKGFLQRIDPVFKKYSFGVIDVVGENKDFDIQGVWMFRGADIPFEMKDHPSYEYQQFKKLDFDKDFKIIEDYFCEKEMVEGKPIHDRVCWK